MRGNGFAHLGADRPFAWAGDIGGLKFCRRHSVWQAGGTNLYAYLCPPIMSRLCEAGALRPEPRYYRDDSPAYIPIRDRNVIAHSHGGQVVFYACAEGLKLSLLITIGTPVRSDMRAIVEKARPNIGHWLHVFESSYWANKMQWLGALFDGHVGIEWRHAAADVNIDVPGVGHSRLLVDPDCFSLWHTHGWLSLVQE
jgi:hypothetical protein